VWKTVEVTGHRYEPSMDKFVLYFEDGSVEEIPQWSKCAVKLGKDWVDAVKSKMEQESGTSVPVNVVK
jgi:hypothetical protein